MAKKNGHSLDYVLIVMAVIGVLAAIVIPSPSPQKSVAGAGEKPVVDKGEKVIVGYAQGKLNGYKYTYQRDLGIECRLTLERLSLDEPNKSEIVMIYDSMGSGTIGDNITDEYTIKIGDFGITYAQDYTAIRNKWEGEIIPRKEALKEATNILEEWQAKIEFIHGCK